MEKYLDKKYKLKSSENFEEYLKFIGSGIGGSLGNVSILLLQYMTVGPAVAEVGLLSRKLVTSLSPVSVLTKNEDGSYSLTMITPIRKVSITFKLGEEFVEDRPDGVKVKSIMHVEGNSLIQLQTEDNGRKSTHVREFTDTVLTVTTTAEGWDGKCIRIYELVE